MTEDQTAALSRIERKADDALASTKSTAASVDVLAESIRTDRRESSSESNREFTELRRQFTNLEGRFHGLENKFISFIGKLADDKLQESKKKFSEDMADLRYLVVGLSIGMLCISAFLFLAGIDAS